MTRLSEGLPSPFAQRTMRNRTEITIIFQADGEERRLGLRRVSELLAMS